MQSITTCWQCGAKLPGDALDGLCPGCLLMVVLRQVETEKPPQCTSTPPDSDIQAEAYSDSLTFQKERRIGRYRLLESLGEGGCGQVYLAEQEVPVRRQVALKVLKLGMDTRQMIARFETERQALAMMDHANIAKVFDAGATETGRPFFVMELVRGTSITEYCDRHRLPVRARLELVLQVCQAIQHAHYKGVIHRDIKPSNILVTLVDSDPVPKVIDFGIAKATQQANPGPLQGTKIQQLIGTPAYMSPEQASMKALNVDTRTDIYSLGVLIYELLTGQTPLDLAPHGGDLEEIQRSIREKEPARPSARLKALDTARLVKVADQRQVQPERLIRLLEGDLDWIVMQCLEKDRTRRYETAAGLRLDIQRFLHHEPVIAHPTSRLDHLQKFVRRHRLGFTAGIAIAASLVIGLCLATWGLLQERSARAEAESAQRSALTQALKNERTSQFLKEMLQSVGPGVARGHDASLLEEILDATSRRLSNHFRGEPEIEADLATTIGQVYFQLGAYPSAEAMHRKALALRRSILSADHPDLAVSQFELANALHRQGKFREAEHEHRQALEMRKRLFGLEHSSVAESLNSLAEAIRHTGDRVIVEQMFTEALAMRLRLLGSDHPKVAESLYHFGCFQLWNRGNYSRAEEMHRQSLAIRRGTWGDNHPDVATSLDRLGLALAHQGKFADAEANYREAYRLRQKLLDPNHQDVAQSMYHLGQILQQQGQVHQAETLHREALSIFRAMLGDIHPDLAGPLHELGETLEYEGRPTEAERLHREALKIRQARFGPEKSSVGGSMYCLANSLFSQGKTSEAESFLRRRLSIVTNSYSWESRQTAYALNDLSQVLLAQNKQSEGEALNFQARLILEKISSVEADPRNIPARDPCLPTECVDLSAFYTHSLGYEWGNPPVRNNNFARLEHPLVSGGIRFDARGLIALAPDISFIHAPVVATGISVSHTCRRIHFLHAAAHNFEIDDGAPLGTYVVEFVDGEKREIPLRYGDNISCFGWHLNKAASNAVIAWRGVNDAGYPIRLFHWIWENERAAVPIKAFNFQSALNGASPIVAAITTDNEAGRVSAGLENHCLAYSSPAESEPKTAKNSEDDLEARLHGASERERQNLFWDLMLFRTHPDALLLAERTGSTLGPSIGLDTLGFALDRGDQMQEIASAPNLPLDYMANEFARYRVAELRELLRLLTKAGELSGGQRPDGFDQLLMSVAYSVLGQIDDACDSYHHAMKWQKAIVDKAPSEARFFEQFRAIAASLIDVTNHPEAGR